MKNKFGAILLSVAIAFGLWLYVITYVSPNSEETYYNIPVVLEGESVLNERGLMCTSTSSSTVSLQLAGVPKDMIESTLRVSFSQQSTEEDVGRFLEGFRAFFKRER